MALGLSGGIPIGLVYALLSMAGYGSYLVFAKSATARHGSVVASTAIHGIGLLLIAAMASRYLYVPSIALLGLIIATGLIGAAGVYLQFLAVQVGDIAIVSPLSNMGGFFILLLGVVFLGERYSGVVYAGAVVVLLGVLLALVRGPAVQASDTGRGDGRVKHGRFGGRVITPGALPAVGFSLILALYGTLSKMVVDELGGIVSAFWLELAVLLWLLPFAVRAMMQLERRDVRPLFIAGLLFGIGSGFLYPAIGLIGLGLTGSIIQAAPIIGVTLAYVLLKERLAKWQWVGVLCTIAGMLAIVVASA
ncbi:hypothetical protein AUJ68_06285 [Candidatus Woesearchaeota archaeon CG1_02_57_44]|nr:MAG: hypothetical protein AUJ68_06285 [Candidatus Woesearchaeota archaeon CG1_02_57_44]